MKLLMADSYVGSTTAREQAPIALIDLAHEPPFELEALRVRPAFREIRNGFTVLRIEPRILQVLVFLARHRGEVVSRQDLIDACWGGRIVGDDALNRCISALRRLAENHGGFTITTVARVGYQLSASAPLR